MTRTKSAVVLLAAVIGIGGTVSTAYAQNDRDHDSDRYNNRYDNGRSEQLDHQDRGDYHRALKALQDARHILALSQGNWDGRRPQALMQTNYAIEQVYAAIGDNAARDKDRDVAARELQAGRDRRQQDEGRIPLDQRRGEMNRALDRLFSARRELINLPPNDPRRQKTIEFTEQAIRDVQNAVAATNAR